MKLQLLPTIIQGVRMLPILYAILGMAEHKAHAVESLRGEFPLLVTARTEHEPEMQAADDKRTRGEAHLLHPHESHKEEGPEPEQKHRRYAQPTLEKSGACTDHTRHYDLVGIEPVPRARTITINYIPPVPERSQPRDYFV